MKGKSGKMVNTITRSNYQAPKKIAPVTDRHAEDDDRFGKYADALKAGDMCACKILRADNKADEIIISKFDMLERMWLAEMFRYVREVQIVRRERDGWQKLAEGYRKILENDSTLPAPRTMLRRGYALLEQADVAREKHIELEVPLGFSGVK